MKLFCTGILASIALSLALPLAASASTEYGFSEGWDGGWDTGGYAKPCCDGKEYGYKKPCCFPPKYPYTNYHLYKKHFDASKHQFDFDQLFAKKKSVDTLDTLHKFNANKRSTAADKIYRLNDTYVDANRKNVSSYDQWKNVKIIAVDEGVSKKNASSDSKTLRDRNLVNDSHYRDNSANVSSLDALHKFSADEAAKKATSVDSKDSTINKDSLNKSTQTGYY